MYIFSHNLAPLLLFLLPICVCAQVCVHVYALLTLLRVFEDLGLGLLLSSGMAEKLGIAFLVDVS